jgi:phosphopantetheine--protein transferase-like protein
MSPWFRVFVPKPDAKRRLVILPHAGGGPAYYRDWVKGVPDDYETVVAQLPGHEARWKEPPLTHMEPIADNLIRELSTLDCRPLTLFGHSLGAVIAYELARRLTVERLIVAGARAPHLPRIRKTLYDLNDIQLLQELKQLGGTPTALLDNEEVFSLFLPTLRADLEVLETYSHSHGKTLDVPLTVVGGFVDDRTPLVDLLSWKDLNSGPTHIEANAGGHFFCGAPGTLTTGAGFLRSLTLPARQEPEQDLHVVKLGQSPETVAGFCDCLDDSERHRADRFLRPEHRDRFIVGRGTLRQILGRHLSLAPSDVRIVVSPSGKPGLHQDHNSDINFNLSHSDHLAAIFIAKRQKVGVDIEQVRGDVDHAGLAERYFAPAERADVIAVDESQRLARFFAYWTGKEAYSKARGLGLNLPLDQYDIKLDDRGYPACVQDRTLPPNQAPWHVCGINIADGFAAAIASEKRFARFRLFGDTIKS